MKKIKSFEIDHTKLEKGLYISRVDDNIITYDLRMVKPNTPPFLENDGIHTFEHLLATFLRNSEYSENVVYVGPMGCRTGFYLLFKDLAPKIAIKLIQDALNFIANYEGEIPGNSAIECGNYLDHNLEKANAYAQEMYVILKNWKCENLQY